MADWKYGVGEQTRGTEREFAGAPDAIRAVWSNPTPAGSRAAEAEATTSARSETVETRNGVDNATVDFVSASMDALSVQPPHVAPTLQLRQDPWRGASVREPSAALPRVYPPPAHGMPMPPPGWPVQHNLPSVAPRGFGIAANSVPQRSGRDMLGSAEQAPAAPVTLPPGGRSAATPAAAGGEAHAVLPGAPGHPPRAMGTRGAGYAPMRVPAPPSALQQHDPPPGAPRAPAGGAGGAPPGAPPQAGPSVAAPPAGVQVPPGYRPPANAEQQRAMMVFAMAEEHRLRQQQLRTQPLGPMQLPDDEALRMLSEDAFRVFRENYPEQEELATRSELLGRLRGIFLEEFPTARLWLYGSSLNGLCARSGDLDICMECQDIAHLIGNNGKETNRLQRTKDEKAEIEEFVTSVAHALERAGMCDVETIPFARVPVVKFVDFKSRIPCDICFNNFIALRNSQMIRGYLAVDPRLRMLIYVVKKWAKARGINNPYQGTLSSYCYAIMSIFVCQVLDEPLVPCLQELGRWTMQNGRPVPQRTIVQGYDSYFFPQPELLAGYGRRNPAPLGLLLFQFFWYYAKAFDFRKDVACIRLGKVLSKGEKGWTRRNNMDRHLVCIEDPFNTEHDLGRTASRDTALLLKNEFRRAHHMLQQGKSLHEILEPVEE